MASFRQDLRCKECLIGRKSDTHRFLRFTRRDLPRLIGEEQNVTKLLCHRHGQISQIVIRNASASTLFCYLLEKLTRKILVE